MKRIKVESSQIKSVGYDIYKRLLEIEFQPKKENKTGAIYQYKCVDYIDVLGILFSDSAGSYFMRNIKEKYNYEKI